MIPLLPLAISWICGVGAFFFDGRKAWGGWFAVSVLACVFLFDVTLLLMPMFEHLPMNGSTRLDTITGGWPLGLGIRLVVDSVSLFFGAICSFVLLLALLHELQRPVASRFFPALVVILDAGLHGAFVTADLFNFYVFFELSVLTSFSLAAYGFEGLQMRATLIYFVINFFASVLFLMGIAALYANFEELDWTLLTERIDALGPGERSALLPASALIFCALAIKIGLFPFHAWMNVLYSHARPVVAAIMAGALVNLGFYAYLRLGWSVLNAARERAAPLLLVLGALAMIYGAVLACHRRAPSVMIIYTAVMQAGYVVLMMGVGGEVAYGAVLVVALSGALDKPLMFLVQDGSGRAKLPVALLGALGIAGFPLTAGFLAKVVMFRSVLSSGRFEAVLGGFALVCSTVAALYVAVRYFGSDLEPEGEMQPGILSAASFAIASVVLGTFATPLVDWVSQAPDKDTKVVPRLTAWPQADNDGGLP